MEFLPKSLLPIRAAALFALVGLTLALPPLAAAQSAGSGDGSGAWVRTILLKEGGRTVSKQDSTTRVLEELTYDKRNVLVKRNIFQLDDEGRPLQGLVFDGNQNMLARIAYGFDRFGRVQEERIFNAAGRVVRRLFYQYAADGTKLPPIGFSYGDGTGQETQIDPSQIAPTIRTPGVEGARPVTGDEVRDGDVGGARPVRPTSIYGR